MSSMLPSLQVGHYRAAIEDYLRTTFALTEHDVAAALDDFLIGEHGRDDELGGMFRGPYLGIRMPFAAATRPAIDLLEWYGAPYPPHGHQLAAFERLSTTQAGIGQGRPLPTLVTTGTGSGKTEAFLFPILDHVRRARRAGVRGMKALILYPMNALVNDQARRLAELLADDPELTGIRAATYVGEQDGDRQIVSRDGLITDRQAIRDEAPDILLTNYKMLDQLLLRPADQDLWRQSATSLRYLVLDEFHSYDGAQGTDVAMLLRRLGLALKRQWPTDSSARSALGITAVVEASSLGLVTPVATSATLGGDDPTVMVDFANTVFGGGFDASSVVGETRLTIEDWVAAASTPPAGGEPLRLVGLRGDTVDADQLRAISEAAGAGPLDLARAVVAQLYRDGHAFSNAMAAELHDALRRHPDVVAIVQAATTPTLIDDLASAIYNSTEPRDIARGAPVIAAIIAALSQVRAEAGFSAPSVDVHAWVREVTRIDRVAGPTAAFRWGDDGREEQATNADAYSDVGREAMPAVYCRHCGRSGWGVVVSALGEQRDLESASAQPRRARAQGDDRFRALIFAPDEADARIDDTEPTPGFGWWGVLERRIHATHPEGTDGADADTNVLPVRWLEGEHAARDTNRDTCPACGQTDGIRFIGAAVATLLSVTITSMFGDANLDADDKKALVFTDSVQDAAHRAGFVQSRSHVFSFRNAVRRALGDSPATVRELVDTIMQQADTSSERYRLLAPDLIDREQFARYWQPDHVRDIDARTRRLVRTRLEFDLALEFGLQSTFARTLERTSSVTVEVDTDSAAKLESAARAAVEGFSFAAELGRDADVDADTLVAWARGTLERLRERGGIDHSWLSAYVKSNGQRWKIWGGRPKGQGMPAFPPARTAPAFARDGSDKVAGSLPSGLDGIGAPRDWYARWSGRILGVTPHEGGQLARRLFAELADAGLVTRHYVEGIGTAYGLDPERLLVQPVTGQQRAAGQTQLCCDSCDAVTAASPRTVEQLQGRPCAVERCAGTLQPSPVDERNYYRSLYEDADMRRVVAREHTSLLPTEVRLGYEQAFKASSDDANAPNVLVATPTLEMGIDIGDLSTVLLASLPRTVANYVQRVGRGGRRTGSALSLAFVPGRLEQLGWYHQPLALIDGEVAAPATYLDAVELAKRQLLAALLDRLSARGELGFVASATAQQVLGSTGEGSLLGRLIELITGSSQVIDEFLDAFGSHFGASTVDTLRAWCMPDDAGVVPAAAQIAAASRGFVTEQEHLSRRIRDLENAIEELQAIAEAPAASDEAADELRAAQTTRRLLRWLRHGRQNEFWVSGLERTGLLPNYSLLDDRVTLDVGVSWVDADTGDYSHDSFEYSRNASNAIREFAPGAMFYARGLEIGIDAVETGPNGDHVHEWACCAECGYVRDLTVDPANGQLGVCPRCGDATFADTGQRLHVLELEAVSAQVRRDESQISDGTDERDRTQFTLVDLVDVDRADVERSWFDTGSGLGVTYARALTIRTLNLGVTGGGASQALCIGGVNDNPTLFRVCRECGQLDRRAGENSWREHRPWCSHRRDRDEDPVTLALSRTLHTQGILLRLPAELNRADDFALPSLRAALRLGLRQVIGGDPVHLDQTIAVDVDTRGATHPAIVIHDRVPGGTGYLADHASPDGLARILLAALDTVTNCACAHEHRSACHRCLLPHTNPLDAPRVWRRSAQAVLRTLLSHDPHGSDPVTSPGWKVTVDDPGKRESASVLESRFAEAVIDGVKQRSSAVSQQPGEGGITYTFVMPHGQVRTMTPQVDMDGARPDFVLESKNAAHGKLVVFVDGHAFHARAGARNRTADDAVKRARLRERPDTTVISVTARDVDEFMRGVQRETPQWIARNPLRRHLEQQGLLTASDLERLSENPIQRILHWVDDPDGARAAWARVAPLMSAFVIGMHRPVSGNDLASAAVSVLDGSPEPGTGAQTSAWGGDGVAAVASIDQWQPPHAPRSRIALVLDDDESAYTRPDALEAWQQWLHWSNVIGPYSSAVITTRSLVGAGPETGAVPARPASATVSVSVAWPRAFEAAFGDDEISRLQELHDSGIVPEPVVGEEIGDGIPVFAHWAKVGVVWDPDGANESSPAFDDDLVVVTGSADDVIALFRAREDR